MKLIISILFACLATVALTSCGILEQEVKVEYRNVVIAPPSNLLEDCDVARPPIERDYVAAPWEKKEEMWLSTNNKHVKNATICNIRNQELRDWKKNQEELLNSRTRLPRNNGSE